MAGKFTNTEWNDTVKSLVSSQKKLMKENPFYIYNDKKHTIVDWYQINEKASCLDEGTKQNWEVLGPNSPFRYDEIKDMALYGGFDKIEMQLSNGDFGLEVEQFGGTSYIVPDTIVPLPNSLFKISYVEKDYLFIVTDVNPDTIESGANVYKIEWSFWRVKEDDWLEKQTINNFVLHLDNVGSEYKSIIEAKQFDSMKAMDELCLELKDMYIDLFYNKNIQNFSYRYMYGEFYDAYFIEFMIRNYILKGSSNYLYLSQAMTVPDNFLIEYNKSIYRHLEKKRKPKEFNGMIYGTFIPKDHPFSFLSNDEKRHYFFTEYCNGEYKYNISLDENMFPIFNLFNEDLYNRINNGKLYDLHDDTLYYKVKLTNIPLDTKHELYKCKIMIIKNINNEVSFKNQIYILKELEKSISYECMIDILKETNLDFKSTLSILKRNDTFYKSTFMNVNNIKQIDYTSTMSIPKSDVLLQYKAQIDIYKTLLKSVSYKTDINIPKFNNSKEFKSTITLYKEKTNNLFKTNFNIPIFDKYNEYKSVVTNRLDNNLSFVTNMNLINLRREDIKTVYNLIIKYFNDIPINEEDINRVHNMIYDTNYYVFYFIPVLIFIFEKLIEEGLTTKKSI